ncbi:hypothetical protein [Gryllotalpicola protaetiae]|uniref:Uncharacterized protein n=1 Tax=Gryllotalpicola protaetiae TaxID=2419771 RepID=A0A387BZ23_9MICO|nr:hypothetical protein [Gryllotalpicola protaetiae]AYG03581.1 hypothetical protein D7I44_08575 [Gryllotalpicola protaetiae]
MRPFARALTLAALSGVTAEFLLGDQWLSGAAPISTQLPELILFIVYYGSAAVLIREFTRRTGRGWPTILLLAFAFGLIEEGLLDLSLFNPHFAERSLIAFGFIPGLGIGGPWTIFVLTLHVVWSIGAPVAIAEALFPSPVRRRIPVAAVTPQTQAPWLRVPGLCVAGGGYLVGAAAIGVVSQGSFVAQWWQYASAAVVAAAAIVIAFRLRPTTPRPARSPRNGILVGFVGGTVFQLLEGWPHSVSPWLACLALLVVLGAGAWASVRFRLDPLGLATGALFTYCWVGLRAASQTGGWPVVEQIVIVVLVVAALALALRRAALIRVALSGSEQRSADPSSATA